MQLRFDRRQHPRFVLDAMYTPITARVVDAADSDSGVAGTIGRFDLEGHAYDISEGGIRFELDQLLKPGTRIALQISLPSVNQHDLGPGRSVLVYANVVWVEDVDDPPPYKMAAVFTSFARVGDRERLLRQFASGRYRAAA